MPVNWEATVYQPDDVGKPKEFRWVLWSNWEAVATGVVQGIDAAARAVVVASSEWRIPRLDVEMMAGETSWRERWWFADFDAGPDRHPVKESLP